MSTKDKGQYPENQLHQLREFAERHGTVYKVCTGRESGGKADHAAFKQLLTEAYQHKFDLVVLWRLDRFSRRRPGYAPLPEGAKGPQGEL